MADAAGRWRDRSGGCTATLPSTGKEAAAILEAELLKAEEERGQISGECKAD
jgi:hypothetical protein